MHDPLALQTRNAERGTRNVDLPVKAFAHITGGGFVDNIPRVLPANCDVVIRKGSWDMLPIFKMIEQKSGVPDDELYQVFSRVYFAFGEKRSEMGDVLPTLIGISRSQQELQTTATSGKIS